MCCTKFIIIILIHSTDDDHLPPPTSPLELPRATVTSILPQAHVLTFHRRLLAACRVIWDRFAAHLEIFRIRKDDITSLTLLVSVMLLR